MKHGRSEVKRNTGSEDAVVPAGDLAQTDVGDKVARVGAQAEQMGEPKVDAAAIVEDGGILPVSGNHRGGRSDGGSGAEGGESAARHGIQGESGCGHDSRAEARCEEDVWIGAARGSGAAGSGYGLATDTDCDDEGKLNRQVDGAVEEAPGIIQLKARADVSGRSCGARSGGRGAVRAGDSGEQGEVGSLGERRTAEQREAAYPHEFSAH